MILHVLHSPQHKPSSAHRLSKCLDPLTALRDVFVKRKQPRNLLTFSMLRGPFGTNGETSLLDSMMTLPEKGTKRAENHLA
jgi:hypothetical protein